MNWSVIAILPSATERACGFLSLQRKRYGREPVQAALALWKGVCSEPQALQILSDVREVVHAGQLSCADLSYLRALLTHFELLASDELRAQPQRELAQ
ncbi:hypothetical protein KJI95_06035 [Shewanella sp. JM162201]|uniref:Uncharacterized protein n=1 Tax=Shewanella jiangmenensis TaxID=2837387 RepID=A0ABS5V0T1_9GAMM|nr:hypothetical protein [Shewanella jiangmenensis]MBT1444082.1 hypothetical protein [Shewanella jiangmenensis]